ARAAFDEALRLSSPVHAFCRTAAVDTAVSGVDIAAGTKVLCVLAAANRDPAQFDQPDDYRIERDGSSHLAFGVGIHGCVGQNLARAEGEAVLGALARRVGELRPDGPARWQPNNAVRGLAALPLALYPDGG
ncbi:MAG: cytochrome P450, partial [Gammaproteobacteria bacterium]